jgi:hypothetical protein
MAKLFGNPTPRQMEFSGLGTPTVRKPDRAFESAYKKQEANLPRASLDGLSRAQTSTPWYTGLGTQVLGLGESMYAGQLAGENVAANQQMWQDQVSAAKPGSTTGLAYGDAVYDEATNTLQYAPSGAAQGMLTSLYGQHQGFADKLSNLDPYALGQQMYDLKRPAMQQAQDYQTAQLLERLKAQGMLSSSHSGQLQGGLAQAQYMAHQQALSEDILNAQNIASAISTQQQQAGGLIDAINTGQLNQLAQNIDMGVNVTPPSSLGTAYENQMDTEAQQGGSLANILGIVGTGIGGSAGGAIGSVIGGLFS